jgi:hypothetical protein
MRSQPHDMFNAYVEGLIRKHRLNGLLVDTNLLLVIIVGRYNPRRIGSFKRTAQYTPADFGALEQLIARFAIIATTPNIMTEVDNLARQLPIREHGAVSRSLSEAALALHETHRPSGELLRAPDHVRLGISDAHSCLLAAQRLLLTDDMDLWGAARSRGFDALNFNHLRPGLPGG